MLRFAVIFFFSAIQMTYRNDPDAEWEIEKEGQVFVFTITPTPVLADAINLVQSELDTYYGQGRFKIKGLTYQILLFQ